MMQAALSHTSSYTVVVVCTLLLFILSAEAFRLPHSRHVTFSKSSSRKHPEGARLTTVAPRAITCREDRAECDDTNDRGILYSRKDLLRSLGLLGSAVACGQVLLAGIAFADDALPTVGKITKNGVKYFEYQVGKGQSPKWGQDCVIRFVMYGRKSPGAELLKMDSSDYNKEPYLFKHGNGRQIRGMEEGMHTMRVGGKRRIVIPKELGYSVQGLGPYPAGPRNRDNLANMLKDIDKFNGELVMDVELLDAFDDEADQGYYEDEALTVDQLQTILDVTSPFAGGNTFEKLPGQVAPVAKSSGPTP